MTDFCSWNSPLDACPFDLCSQKLGKDKEENRMVIFRCISDFMQFFSLYFLINRIWRSIDRQRPTAGRLLPEDTGVNEAQHSH